MSRAAHSDGRLLLVVSAGLEAVRGLARLKRSGWTLAVLDGDPDAPGFALADEKLVVSTYDVGAAARMAIELHRRRPVSGVLSIAADVPHTVAHIARTLGLPGLDPSTATLAMDKVAMKECFAREGVPIPWFAEVHSAQEVLMHMRQHGLVLKPVDSRGARGVLRLDETTDLDWAFERARDISPSGRVMVEEYIQGPQLSTESMIHDGRAFTSGLSDRNYELLERTAPYVIENGGDQPSNQGPDLLARVDPVIEAAARAIGLRNGVLKGDLVLGADGQPIVIEVAPRLSGGYFCTDQIPLSTGIDLVECQARVAVGETLTPGVMTPATWLPTCIRYFFPPVGKVLAIDGFDAMRSREWVKHAGLFLEPGDTVQPPTDHTQRAGFVLVTGATRAEAQQRAQEAVDTVKFQIEAPTPASAAIGTEIEGGAPKPPQSDAPGRPWPTPVGTR